MQEQDTILVVDDMEVNRAILCEIFRDDFRILEAEDGEQALRIINEEEQRLAIILLDIIMPNMDGFQVLENISESVMKRVPVILITGDTTDLPEEKGYELEAADVIRKPFMPHIARKRVENIINLWKHKNNLEHLVRKQTEKLEKRNMQLQEINNKIIDSLAAVVEFRDLESGEHIKRIKGFTELLLKYVVKNYKEYEITPEQVEKIVEASAMHDVGKIAIPDNVLLKPGRLTDEEFELMKLHTVKGCEIINNFSFINDKETFQYCYEICRHHHERYDGRGYPDHLKGEEISIAAQVVSLADVYDALVSDRVYKAAYTTEEAYRMILNGECGTFSPKLLECFKMAKQEFEDFKNSTI